MLKAIVDADHAIRSSLHLKSSMIEDEIGEGNELNINRYAELDTSSTSPKQNVTLYLLESLYMKDFRRYKGHCYSKVYTEEGHDTHCWESKMDIKKFIYDVCRKETSPQMWANFTSGNFEDWIINYLENHRGPEFEDIKKDRNVFSFRNGIYFTKNYSEERGWYSEFIPYESKKIGSSVVSSKFFNLNFDETLMPEFSSDSEFNDPFNIILKKCPHFHSIMTYQKWDTDVQQWLCICLGRLCFNLKELDGWQVLPYLLGQAGSGKSTLIDNFANILYEECDIGTLSNNMEEKFGLGALYDKFLLTGPEIRACFKMDQSEFQSMITGENIQIAIKHKDSINVKWRTPCFMAGNEIPNYTDNAGSISRRLLIFIFGRKVNAGASDTQLGNKIKKEFPNILQACVRMYLQAVNKYGTADVWNIVPKQLKDNRDDIAETTNALIHYIKSDKVRLGPDCYVKEADFVEAFNRHCQEMNMGKIKWSKQYAMGPFESFGIEIKKLRKRYPKDSNKSVSCNFMIGIELVYDLQEHTEENEDEEKTNLSEKKEKPKISLV